jgi:four helix bundle protein
VLDVIGTDLGERTMLEETKPTRINLNHDLTAWQKAMDLVGMIYDETSRLPADERFGLVSQMRRCAANIRSNIAQGWGRRTPSEYLRFLCIDCGSSHELPTQAEICDRLGLAGDWQGLQGRFHEVGRILNGLLDSIQKRIPTATSTS